MRSRVPRFQAFAGAGHDGSDVGHYSTASFQNPEMNEEPSTYTVIHRYYDGG